MSGRRRQSATVSERTLARIFAKRGFKAFRVGRSQESPMRSYAGADGGQLLAEVAELRAHIDAVYRISDEWTKLDPLVYAPGYSRGAGSMRLGDCRSLRVALMIRRLHRLLGRCRPQWWEAYAITSRPCGCVWRATDDGQWQRSDKRERIAA